MQYVLMKKKLANDKKSLYFHLNAVFNGKDLIFCALIRFNVVPLCDANSVYGNELTDSWQLCVFSFVHMDQFSDLNHQSDSHNNPFISHE